MAKGVAVAALSAIVLMASSCANPSYDKAEFIENSIASHPAGSYFRIGNDYFRVCESHDVHSLGAYGLYTGRGLTGPLNCNGFSRQGRVRDLESYKSKAIDASGIHISGAAASGNASAVLPTGNYGVGGRIETSLERDETYSVVLVSLDDVQGLRGKIKHLYETNPDMKDLIERSDFRIIDTVLYGTNVRIDTISEFHASAVVDGTVDSFDISAKIVAGADSTSERHFKLNGDQIIAYSYRKLCWKDGKITHMNRDRPGEYFDDCPDF